MRCSYGIGHSSFNDSHAQIKGGAIYYDLYRPQLINNTHHNNTAQYGNNIASYPIKIRHTDSNQNTTRNVLSNVVSGQVHSPSLQFDLVDHDDQIILTDSSSTIKINKIDDDTSVDGVKAVVVSQGSASFDEVIFKAKPGSSNVMFEVTSTAIKNDILMLQYNGTAYDNNIDTSFRYCESGEIEVNDQCQV